MGSTLRIEAAGRSSLGVPGTYEDPYWHHARRVGTPWPSRRWRYDAVAVVAHPCAGPQGARAAAEATEAIRRELEDPSGAAMLGKPTGLPALEAALLGAVDAGRAAVAASGRSAADGSADSICSLVVVGIQGENAVAVWTGDAVCCLRRADICDEVQDSCLSAQSAPSASLAQPAPDNPSTTRPSRPTVRSFQVQANDILVLTHRDVLAAVDGVRGLGRVLASSRTIQEACERVVLESRLQEGPTVSSCVILGVELSPASPIFTDQERSPMGFHVALHMSRAPGLGPDQRARLTRRALALGEGRAIGSLAQAMLVQGDPTAASLPPALGPTDDPRPPEPAPPPSLGIQAWKPDSEDMLAAAPNRGRASRWRALLTVLALVVGVVAVGVGGWLLAGGSVPGRQVPGSLPSVAVDGPQGPLAAAESMPAGGAAAQSESAAPAEATEYHVVIRTMRTCLIAASAQGSRGSVECVVQARDPKTGKWRDIERDRLEPGQVAVIPLPERVWGQKILGQQQVDCAFVSEADGQLRWAAPFSPERLPANCRASVSPGRVNIGDTEAGVLVVLRPSGAAPAAVGRPATPSAIPSESSPRSPAGEREPPTTHRTR